MLERTGQTEAAVDLARLAGLIPAGVICEVMNDDGTMARVPDLVPYCERHDLKMITVADLIAYRRRTEKLVERVVSTALPTAFGDFTAVGYRSLVDDKHHVAMVKGDVDGAEDVLVRVHSECLTGDVFHSHALRLRRAARGGAGDDRAGGRGRAALPLPGGARDRPAQQAARLQAAGGGRSTRSTPTSSSACRPTCATTGSAPRSSVDLGLTSIRILTNNPKKIVGLEGYGLSVTEQVPIEAVPNPHNEAYLRAKRDKHRPHAPPPGPALDEEMIHDEERARRDGRAGWLSRRLPRGSSATTEREALAPLRVRRLRRPLLRGPRRAPAERRRRGLRAGRRQRRPRSHTSRSRAPTSCRFAAKLLRRVRPLRRGRLPRRRDPRRDRPLRLRLRRGRARDPGRRSSRPACPAPSACITCDTMEQALARAGGDKRDQGRNAALTVAAHGAAARAPQLRATLSRRYHPRPMAKVCHSCGKGPAFGNSRSHSMVATRRRFDPNLQKVRIQEDGGAHAARLRLHALPEGQQGHQGRLGRRTPAGSRLRLALRMADPSDRALPARRSARPAAHLEARRQEVNDLNVFPVADGDTGRQHGADAAGRACEELDRLDGADGRRDRPRRDRRRGRARRADGRARQLGRDPQPDRPRRRRGARQPPGRAGRPGAGRRGVRARRRRAPTSRCASRPRGRC